MKNPKLNAQRWLAQAEYDFKKSEENLKSGDFAYTCFFAEQSSQKSLKAYLIFRGERFVVIHSVGELAKEAAKFDKAFESLIDFAKKLDRHYLAARYPDAVPEPAVPFESYVKDEAEEAVEIAGKILELSKELILLK
ncbi:HEPN domain-containing protein [Candidatus Wolfebacteria bacterium]|nr:HEPN domain-containing protein [Candidatus Wolfebacteria bacterium]